VETEFELLAEEVERVVYAAAEGHEGADAERAMDLLTGFLEQARRGSLRAFRAVARNASA
jgi:hypothetical protein